MHFGRDRAGSSKAKLPLEIRQAHTLTAGKLFFALAKAALSIPLSANNLNRGCWGAFGALPFLSIKTTSSLSFCFRLAEV